MKTACKECGKVFDKKRSDQVFCSKPCTLAWHTNNTATKRRDAKVWEGTCAVCGIKYGFASHRSKYCSQRCKDRAHQVKRRKQEPLEKVCTVCGEKFLTASNVRKRCGECMVRRSRHGWKRISMEMRKDRWVVQGHVCWLCRKPLKELESVVHHLDGSGQDEEPNQDEDNLVVLHPACHAMFHHHTILKVDGEWCVGGRIFKYLAMDTIKVKRS